MNDRQAEFMEAIAQDVEVWVTHVLALLSEECGPMSTDVPDAYRRLRPLLATGEAQQDLEAILAEAIRGYAHALLVELDGGGRIDGFEVVDTLAGRPLGEGLHELFFAHLFDTGRM